MRCRKIISQLNAYADGELTEKRRRTVKDHLVVCEACRKRLADIRSLARALNNALPVPLVPAGFRARLLNEARKRRRPEAAPAGTLPFLVWNPLRWITEQSLPMRAAVSITVLLAVAAGWSLNDDKLTERVSSKSPDSRYGIEWFDPTPPGSIGSVYIAMTRDVYKEGNGQ